MILPRQKLFKLLLFNRSAFIFVHHIERFLRCICHWISDLGAGGSMDATKKLFFRKYVLLPLDEVVPIYLIWNRTHHQD